MPSPTLRMRSIGSLAIVVASSFATACGSDGEITDPGGSLGSSFSATVTGGSAGSYSGGLSSAVQSGGLFSIGLSTADGKFALAFTRSGARPATGTYPLGTNPQTGFTAALNVNGGQAIYSSTSGTLTITASSSTEIKGTFQFTGALSAGTGAAANVSGSFTTACPGGC